MPLNIHVEAEPQSMRALAAWMRNVAGQVRGASDRTLHARTASNDGWQGDAAEGFRAVGYRISRDADTLDGTYTDSATTIEGHANDIEVVRNKMGDARDIATKAGLRCTDREIADPGEPPPKPQPHSDLDSGNEALEKVDAWRAWHDWHAKAQAYAKCATLATEARRIEQDSQNAALNAVQGMAEGTNIITATNFLNGLAAGYITQQSSWRANVDTFKGIAEDALREGRNPTHGSATQGKNLVLGLVNQARATITENRANTNYIGHWLEKLPEGVKKPVTSRLGEFIPAKATYLAKAPAVLKSISSVGGTLAGVAAGLQIADGKNPATAVASNGAGLITGTATGMFFGGPIGAVGAFIVGTGTTAVVDDSMTPDPEDRTVIAPGPPPIQQMNRPPL